MRYILICLAHAYSTLSFSLSHVYSTVSLIEWCVELAGGVHCCHIDTQEPRQRLLCPQKQSGGLEQARSFPQIDWKACECIEIDVYVILPIEIMQF